MTSPNAPSAITPRTPPRGTRVALIFGVLAVTGGGWLLLETLGVHVSFQRLWPLFLLLVGLASLVDYGLTRRPFSAGLSVMAIGIGVLGFALTLDFTSLTKILDWLPSFPTILGLAFLAAWLAGGRRMSGQLVAGIVFLALGLLGFAARFDWLQALLPSAQMVWAVTLLLGGAALLWRVVQQSRR